MVRCRTAAFVVLLAGVPLVVSGFQTAAATNSAAMVGWYQAEVAKTGTGSGTYTPGGAALPSGLTIYMDSSSALHANGGASAVMRCNGTGTPNSVFMADVVGKGTITTSDPNYAFLKWTIQLTYHSAASANAEVYNTGATGQGSGLAYLARAKTPVVTDTMGDSENDDGPRTLKQTAVVNATTWSGSPGNKVAAFAVPLHTVGGSGNASSGVYRGNMFAAQGAGAGDVSVAITGVKGTSSGGGTVVMYPPSGATTTFMDLYNSGGSLVDQWMIETYTDGSGTLDVDNYASGTYTLLIHAPGTLVSKVVASISPTGSTTLTPTWRFGDLDGDNYVSQAEINFIQAHLGENANSMDAYFPPPGNSPWYTVHDADFNHDGVITQADLDLATPNVGVHGDTL